MRALAFDGSQTQTTVGYYTYAVAEGRWFWSDGVFELHGYAPNAVPATTELMIQHKHPDDAARAIAVLDEAIRDGRPFTCYHRIIDAKRRVRSVLSVGRGKTDVEGEVEEVIGFFVDLTEVRRTETQLEVEEALLRIAETRSVIDQAKGMVMLATGCDADKAFGVLRTFSSHKNVRLHELAHRLVAAVAAGPVPDDSACRRTMMATLEGLQPNSTEDRH